MTAKKKALWVKPLSQFVCIAGEKNHLGLKRGQAVSIYSFAGPKLVRSGFRLTFLLKKSYFCYVLYTHALLFRSIALNL